MAIVVKSFDEIEHSLIIDLGNGTEMRVNHLSDQQLANLKSVFPVADNAPDPTPSTDLIPNS